MRLPLQAAHPAALVMVKLLLSCTVCVVAHVLCSWLPLQATDCACLALGKPGWPLSKRDSVCGDARDCPCRPLTGLSWS